MLARQIGLALAQQVGVVGLTVLLGWLSAVLPGEALGITVFPVPLALPLVLGIRCGRWTFPGLALGAFAVILLLGQAWWLGLANAATVLAQAWLGLLLCRHGWLALDDRLERSTDMVRLIFWLTMPVALVGTLSHLLFRHALLPPPTHAWLFQGGYQFVVCWLASLILVPVALVWSRPPTYRRAQPTRTERLVWGSCVIFVCQFTLSSFGVLGESFLGIGLLIIMAGWTALRFEVRGIALFHLVAGTIGLVNAYAGFGPLTGQLQDATELTALGFITLTVICLLLLAGVLAEHRNTIQDRQFLVAALQHRQRDLEEANHRLLTTTALQREQATRIEQMFQDLQRSEERLHKLLENSSDGISILDGQRQVTYLSPAARQMLGVREGSDLLTSVHPEDRDYVQREWERLHERTTESMECSFRVLSPEGAPRVIEAVFRNLLHDSTIQGIVLNSREITERRRMHEQMLQTSKLEAIGLLAGGIAHDFNNLLTAMLGALSILRPVQDAEQESILRVVEQAGRRAADLTGKLLSFARRQQLTLGPVHLEQVIDETVQILRRTIDPRIAIETAYAPESVPVWADAGQMQSVVFNLGVNARDAMPEGGQLTIRTRVVEVSASEAERHSGVTPGRFVCLTIEDTGQGMDEATRQRSFEPFFTTKPVGKGTGLGLAVVYGVVQQHRGWIELHSELGQGTRFEIYLPAVRPAQIRSSPGTPEDTLTDTALLTDTQLSGTIQPYRILVVEDEDPIRMLARLMLEQAGFQVIEAADGLQAVEIFRKQYPTIDLVLLDRTMPHISGVETFRRLKTIDPHVQVLFCSGYAIDAEEEIVDAAGFLRKPYQRETLIQAVYQALSNSEEPRPSME